MSSREHRLLATDRRVRAMFGGEVIADTPAAWMGFGGYKPPLYELGTWWFDRAHVRTELLQVSDHRTVCDVRGPATYWDIVAGGRRVPHGAYAYEQAPDGWEALRGLITFAWNEIDHWYEEELEVFVHPRGPMHRVDALRSSRHVQVSLDGVPLADTRRPVALFETGMPVRWYIPQADIALEQLTESPTRTQCPYKGVAEYYSVRAGARRIWRGPTRSRFSSAGGSRSTSASSLSASTSRSTANRRRGRRPSGSVRSPRATCSRGTGPRHAIDAFPSHIAPIEDGLTPVTLGVEAVSEVRK